ncbi:MAG: filamentous hemagglutinin N-terminal domain-containing protein, partial [Cyanobacteria bacterium J06626_18]
MAHYIVRSLFEKLGHISIFNAAGILIFVATAEAQNAITPDDTLGAESSVVVPFNADTDVITGGATRGQNLFHSFEEFGIGEGNGAYFITETEAIANIFARVTGSNISDIQGVLGTRQFTGTGFAPTGADLFLINPNGVVFGEGAALDVGGSFAATTATDVQFGDAGSFSTLDPDAPPSLLTIDPSAYIFNQLPIGDITSRSTRSDLIDGATEGLRVPDGETLTLLGGAIAIDG